jgi:multidrug efflux system membrane fusion protein
MMTHIPKLTAKPVAMLGLATCFVAILAACNKNDNAKPANQGSSGPAVTVSQPIQKDVVESDEYTGRMEAVETVEIRARVSGYLSKIYFRDGAKVKKGDLLYLIDPRPYQNDVERTAADVTRLEASLVLAQNDLARAERLIKTRAISEQDYDTRSKAVTQAGAALRSAKAALETAKLNLEFTQIRAPISGRMSRTLKTEGNLVNGSAGEATLLTTLVSTNPIYVYMDVEERQVLKVRRLVREGKMETPRDRPNQVPVELGLADEAGFPHRGLIDFTEPRVDPSTGTMRVRAVFQNDDDQLSPGFFARVRAPGSGKYPALLVTDRAVGSDQGKKFVFVVNDSNIVEYRAVKPGPLIDGLRVIQEGLKAGEWVIVNGIQRARPGMQVKAERAAMTDMTASVSAEAATPAAKPKSAKP